MNRFLSRSEGLIDKAFDILIVLVLVIGIYYAVDAFLIYRDADAGTVAVYKPTKTDPTAYKNLSEDCVGWVAVYDSGIDYPIMQGKDNSEYLNKDPYGAYSLSGSIFLDSRNDPKFKDAYSLVYGHHMEGDYMFGVLDDFEVEEYFDTHRRGELVVDGRFYNIETFAFARTDASEGAVFNPDIDTDRRAWAKANAQIYREPKGDRIVALTTCKTPESTLRTIVFVSILGEK